MTLTYDFYEQNWKEKVTKGNKKKNAFSKEALIKYVNQTGGYMGEVTDIAVE